MSKFLKDDPYRSDVNKSNFEIKIDRLEKRQTILEEKTDILSAALSETQEKVAKFEIDFNKFKTKTQDIKDKLSVCHGEVSIFKAQLPLLQEIEDEMSNFRYLKHGMQEVKENYEEVFQLNMKNQQFLSYAEPCQVLTKNITFFI